MGRKFLGWLTMQLFNWLKSPSKSNLRFGCGLIFLFFYTVSWSGSPAPTVQSVAIQPADCNVASGRASIEINFNPLDFNFEWVPDLGIAANSAGNKRISLPAGQYSVTIRAKSDPTCFTVYSFSVANADGPSPASIVTSLANCVASGTIDLSPINYTYSWSDGGLGAQRTGLLAGQYHVTIEEPGNACLNYIDIDLTANGYLEVVPFVNRNPDCNQSNGSVSLQVSGGSGNYSYSWGNATQSSLAAGPYVVTVTDNISGCFGAATFVLENAVAKAQISGDSIVQLTCAGQRDGFNPSLNISFPDPAFVQPSQSRIIDAGGLEYLNGDLGPGTYCNVVTDGNGCVAGSFCFSVIAPPAIVATYEVEGFTCNTGGSIQLDVSGGYGGFTYDWSDLSGNVNPANRTNLAAGTYQLSITDQQGCLLAVNDIEVDDNCNVSNCISPEIEISINNSDCGINNGQAIVSLPNNDLSDYTITWQPNISQTDTARNLAPGTYAFNLAEIANPGCSKDTSFTIVENCPPLNCDTPVIASVLVDQATCGSSNGKISLNMLGDPANYTYSWQPNIGNSFEVTNIPVGVYEVTIAHLNDPNCATTKTILVNNIDGPQVNILSTTPATCQQNNGTAVLEPVSFQYNWCNGRVGNNVIDLPAGQCNVTITNPADGCNNVVSVFIDAINILAIDTIVNSLPSCNMANGSVTIDVSGGSNSYNFLWEDGSTLASRSDLAGGAYRVTVTDNSMNGCQSEINFVLSNNIPGKASVQGLSSEISVSCPGATDAGATFTPVFDPSIFVLPPTFRFFDKQGIEKVNGQLAKGEYCLVIYDGNNCVAGGACFTVIEPSPLQLSIITSDKDCLMDGTASLMVSGGTPDNSGNYTFNWSDLPGNDNPGDRTDLMAGTFTVTVSDINGCSIEKSGLQITDVCIPCGFADTQIVVLTVDDIGTTCFDLETCFDPLMTTYQLSGGAIAGSSAFGDWNIGGDGCLRYRAGTTTGLSVDTICVVATYNGITDTACYIITLVEQGALPETDTIYLDVISMEGFDTCLTVSQLPGGFANASTVYGPVNNTGVLTVSSLDSCIRFFADAGVIGDFVDTMSVQLCDPMMICDTFIIIVSIAPAPCPEYYFGPDFIPVNNCDTIVELCMDGGDISSIGALSIIDNGEPYAGVVRGCNIDSSRYYLNLRFDDPGNYVLLKWAVNGDTLRNVNFSTLQELADSMSNFDPNGMWTIDGVLLIGGGLNVAYSNLCIEANGSPLPPEPIRLLTQANGISIELDTGFHEVIIENTRNLCADTFSVTISCAPPFIVDSLIGIPEGTTTLFCLETGRLDTITSITNRCPGDSNGNVSWSALVEDGCVELTGEQLGLDTFCLEFCDAINDTCIQVNIFAQTLPVLDSIELEIGVGFTDTICINTDLFSGGADTIYNACLSNSGTTVNFELDEDTYCIYFTGLITGVNTACIVTCDSQNLCDTTVLVVNVVTPVRDTVRLDLEIGEIGIFCIDTMELAGIVQSFNEVCLSGVGAVTDFVIEDDSLCVSYEGIAIGVDSFCLVICDDAIIPVCDTTVLIINVIPGQLEPPIAIDDFGTTLLENRTTLNILANDTVNGNLINVILITLPIYGDALVNPDYTITYNPDPNVCGVIDSFDYVLITTTGQDTATVRIEITCDQLKFFSGFSPNNDGVNDTWQILGINDFPNNEVNLYNRWGNLVYSAKGYTNTDAWNGTWKGKDLPDALYFYVVKDGEGNSYSGYVQLQR